MQRRYHPRRTAQTRARPAAEVFGALLAGALFVALPLAVLTAPGLTLAAVAALATLTALHHARTPDLRVVLRTVLARVTPTAG